MALPEYQVTKLMDLLKIPVEKRNFEELWDQIQNLIEEKEKLPVQIQSKNDDCILSRPLEKILNNPGLVYLAENIFGNLTDEDVEICRHINQSSKQILDNPMFWLRKFKSISKANQRNWINVIQSLKNFEKIKAIILYFQWNLKKEGSVDLPCYTSPDVQDEFREKISFICRKSKSSDEDVEIVKIFAPLTDNPNALIKNGITPIHYAASNGNTEIVKILAPLTDNPNAPDKNGMTPIQWAAF